MVHRNAPLMPLVRRALVERIEVLGWPVAVATESMGVGRRSPRRQSPPGRGAAARGLAGLHSARVGTYRVVYEIDQGHHVIRVVYIDHRADVYRPR